MTREDIVTILPLNLLWVRESYHLVTTVTYCDNYDLVSMMSQYPLSTVHSRLLPGPQCLFRYPTNLHKLALIWLDNKAQKEEAEMRFEPVLMYFCGIPSNEDDIELKYAILKTLFGVKC